MAIPAKDQPLVIGIGELLWDLLPDGRQLGGAPANFAFHAHSLGARVGIISRIGNDKLGRDMLGQLKNFGLPDDWLQIDEQTPTGTVAVHLDNLGVPRFEISATAAWDHLAVTDEAMALAESCDAISFGSLAQRRPQAGASIRQLVSATRPDALRLFDINLRQQFYTRATIEASLELANALKLNDQELLVLAEMFGLKGATDRQIASLSARFEIETIALTRGADGSLLYRAGHWSEMPGKSIPVVDTVGAGDSFSATLVVGLLHKMELEAIHSIATEVAGHVCGHAGAMPKLPKLLRASFAPLSTTSTVAPS